MSGQSTTVYLDLDGTLLDVRDRYYALYLDLVRGLGSPGLARTEFWTLKQRRASLDALLPDLDPEARASYGKAWESGVESESYLWMDRLLPGTMDALRILAGKHRLVVATMRHDRKALLGQLRRLRLDGVLDRIISGADRAGGPPMKGCLIREDRVCHSGDALVVGDTEADVAAARFLGLPSVCVLSGIRERAFLEALRPSAVIDSVADLPPIVNTVLSRARLCSAAPVTGEQGWAPPPTKTSAGVSS